ncbi:MAG: hypothetical protein U1E73_04505 [Planctomycetota bacterium]
MTRPLGSVLFVVWGAATCGVAQVGVPPAPPTSVATMRDGDPRWEVCVALRQRLGLPAKQRGEDAPAVNAGRRAAMRWIREAQRLAAAELDTSPRGRAEVAARPAKIAEFLRAAVAADRGAVPALLALATTSTDAGLVHAALVAAGREPVPAADRERVMALLFAVLDGRDEPFQRLAFGPLVDCLGCGSMPREVQLRLAAALDEELPPAAELKTDEPAALARHPVATLPDRTFGAPVSAAARRVALAALTGNGALVRRIAESGADPRFVLQCSMLAAPRCDRETAAMLFRWYSPHVAKWDFGKQPGFNAWQLGIVDTLVAIYPQLPPDLRAWHACLAEPPLAVAARRALARRFAALRERGGWRSTDCLDGLDVANGLALYAALASAEPWSLATCVAAAAPQGPQRQLGVNAALQQAPLGRADEEVGVLSALVLEPTLDVAVAAARRGLRHGEAGGSVVQAFLGSARADAARRRAALEFAIEASAPLPAGLAKAANPLENELIALHAAAAAGEERPIWASVDAYARELPDALLRAVLFAAVRRPAWPAAFATLIAGATTHADSGVRRAAYRALASRDPAEVPTAVLAGEAVFDPDYGDWQ